MKRTVLFMLAFVCLLALMSFLTFMVVKRTFQHDASPPGGTPPGGPGDPSKITPPSKLKELPPGGTPPGGPGDP